MNSTMNIVVSLNCSILTLVFTNLVTTVAADAGGCKAGDKATCALSTAEAFVDAVDETHLLQTKLEVHEAPHGKGAHAMGAHAMGKHIHGSGTSFDCAMSFIGLDKLLATPLVNCDQQKRAKPCIVNVFNPTFQSTHNSMGLFYGHARLLVVRDCPSCPFGNNDISIKRHCVNACLQAYKNHGLADKFWVENYLDGTLGGWLDPKKCSFQVDEHAFQPRVFDRRDFGAFRDSVNILGLSTVQRKEHVTPLVEPSIWTYLQRSVHGPSPSAPLKSNVALPQANLSLTHMATNWTRMIYSDASGPCWNECNSYIPEKSFVEMCPDTEHKGMSFHFRHVSKDLGKGGPLSDSHGDAFPPPKVVSRTSQATGKSQDVALPLNNVQEKNWSPFSYKGKLLFVYTWQPFRVCRLDDASPAGSCNLCREVSITETEVAQTNWLKIMNMVQLPGTAFHLNGLPIVWVGDTSIGFNGYLGVGHAVSSQSTSVVRKTTYTHFFFRMSSEPPFQVLDVSAPIELKHAVSSAVFWSNMRHEVDTSFVSGFSVLEKKPGQQEILIAYGDGDNESRLLRMSLSEALSLFPK